MDPHSPTLGQPPQSRTRREKIGRWLHVVLLGLEAGIVGCFAIAVFGDPDGHSLQGLQHCAGIIFGSLLALLLLGVLTLPFDRDSGIAAMLFFFAVMILFSMSLPAGSA